MKLRLIIGIILIVAGAFGATRDIPTQWHYFGTGTVMGVGIGVIIGELILRLRKSKKDF